MTTATPTAADLRAQLSDVQRRLDDARSQAGEANARHGRLRSLALVGKATTEEIAAAALAVSNAEEEVALLTVEMAPYPAAIAELEAEEQAQHRAVLAERAAGIARSRTKGLGRFERALRSVTAALAEVGACDAELAAVRADVAADLGTAEAAIEQKYEERVEELRRSAPIGQEPNYPSLAFRRDNEIRELRERVARDAAAVAPPPAAEDVQGVVDQYTGLGLRLLDSETKATLAAGAEFLTGPLAARGVEDNMYTGIAHQHVYGNLEFEAARDRFYAMRELVSKLAA